MGVELNIPTFHSMDALALLPSWLLPDMQPAPDLEDSDIELPQRAPMHSSQLLSQAVTIPGLLHIIDNILTDINERLEGWLQFWEHLQAVAKLVCNSALLERYVRVLMTDTESASDIAMFDRFTAPPLYEKRWNVVISFLSVLLPRFEILRRNWNRSKFQGEGLDNLMLAGLDKAFSSQWFVAYTQMVYEVHIIFSETARWLESCSCHEGLFRPRRRVSSSRKPIACPMRGRSA